jgi:hypothetical protein
MMHGCPDVPSVRDTIVGLHLKSNASARVPDLRDSFIVAKVGIRAEARTASMARR